MTLKEVYDFLVKEGRNADPRGKAVVEQYLTTLQETYAKSSGREKEEFDQEKLTNPYSDTRILFGDAQQKIKTILIGIDIEAGELLLADRLNQKGQKIDLVMSHHPEGKALAALADVMDIHTEMLKHCGVSISVAESLMAERIAEVRRKILPANHTRAVDVARHLNLAFMCCHTPADNHVASYLQKLMEEKAPRTLGNILDILKDITEYRYAVQENAGPKIISGERERQAGKIFVDMTGGTEGSKEVFQRLAQAGVGTIIAMHLSEEHFRKAKEEHVNAIIAGHIGSDNLGLNLLLDKLEKEEQFCFLECSGFRRVKRG